MLVDEADVVAQVSLDLVETDRVDGLSELRHACLEPWPFTDCENSAQDARKSASGGKVARLICALAPRIAALSKDAMRAATPLTHSSSSVSGTARVTHPYRSARSAS